MSTPKADAPVRIAMSARTTPVPDPTSSSASPGPRPSAGDSDRAYLLCPAGLFTVAKMPEGQVFVRHGRDALAHLDVGPARCGPSSRILAIDREAQAGRRVALQDTIQRERELGGNGSDDGLLGLAPDRLPAVAGDIAQYGFGPWIEKYISIRFNVQPTEGVGA